MTEQSHLDAMRAAIRGDLERARARRPSIFERPAAAPPEVEEPEPLPVPVPVNEPEPEVLAAPLPDPEPERQPGPSAQPEPVQQRGPRRRRFRFWRR